MKTKLATLALLIAATVAQADTLMPETVGLHLGSRHSNYQKPWNDSNPGVYARWHNGVTVGTYYNSERRQSYYAGWSMDWDVLPRVQAGVMLGVITGYEPSVLPMVVPSVRLAITENLGLRTSLIYNPRKTGASAVHLSVEWKF